MPAAIRPYSIAVAPDSSFRNAVILDTGSLLVDVAMEVPVRSWNRLKPGRRN
jgi:hypothetical protein